MTSLYRDEDGVIYHLEDESGVVFEREDLEDAAIPKIVEAQTHAELAEAQVEMECRNIRTDLGMKRAVNQVMRDNDHENLAGVYADNASDDYLLTILGFEQGLSEAQVTAAAHALGFEPDDDLCSAETIEGHVSAHYDTPLPALKTKLDEKQKAFEEAGGRGVALADEIDSLLVAVAVRELMPNPE